MVQNAKECSYRSPTLPKDTSTMNQPRGLIQGDDHPKRSVLSSTTKSFIYKKSRTKDPFPLGLNSSEKCRGNNTTNPKINKKSWGRYRDQDSGPIPKNPIQLRWQTPCFVWGLPPLQKPLRSGNQSLISLLPTTNHQTLILVPCGRTVRTFMLYLALTTVNQEKDCYP